MNESQLLKARSKLYVGHPDYPKLSAKLFYLRNKERCRLAANIYRSSPERKNRAKFLAKIRLANNPLARQKANDASKRYYAIHKSSINRKRNTRFHSKGHGLMRLLSIKIHKIGKPKSLVGPPIKDLSPRIGCSFDQFVYHFQSLFHSGMSWHNYGTLWEIGHKIPVRSFNNDLSRLKECYHFTNLHPELVRDNALRLNEISSPVNLLTQ